MNQLPREARDGIMRAWISILQEKHPGTTWVPVGRSREVSDRVATDPTASLAVVEVAPRNDSQAP